MKQNLQFGSSFNIFLYIHFDPAVLLLGSHFTNKICIHNGAKIYLQGYSLPHLYKSKTQKESTYLSIGGKIDIFLYIPTIKFRMDYIYMC